MNKQTHFITDLKKVNDNNFHPSCNKVIEQLPDDIIDIPNIIIYGANNIGKYHTCLNILQKYSPTKLKYEKKVSIISPKKIYTYKISDIHIEIDMEFLGCNAKTLWHSIYNHVYDIACIKPNKHFIMVCKNFNKIHSELLDNFYSYMQENHFNSINVRFILLTNCISFIPPTILNISKIISLKLPNKKNLQTYHNIYNKKIDSHMYNIHQPYIKICNLIIDMIKDYKDMDLSVLREECYNLLVYQFDIQDSIEYIVNSLVKTNYITDKNIHIILVKTYTCLKYYNNNYRAIYHLENYFITLIKHIYDIK